MAIAGFLLSAPAVAAPKGVDAAAPAQGSRAEPNLIAFVGRMLEWRFVEPPKGRVLFDAEHAAKFEVLQVLFGSYSGKTILFSSYAHEGGHDLGAHEYWIVYVSRDEAGRFVQQRYLEQLVHPTSGGQWAGCGDPYAGMPPEFPRTVKPEPVTFSPPVKFKTRDLSRKELDQLLGSRSMLSPEKFKTRDLSREELDQLYPERFFRREGNSVTCVMGNYPRELFQVIAETYLKNRGVIGSSK